MIYGFENFEVDPVRAELRRDGSPVPVEPQVFELIRYLVAAPDRVVSRDEIFSAIWGERIVSDAALSSRIRDARKALDDDGTAQRLIRTVQRRGLRFVGIVTELPEEAPAIPAEATPAPPPPQLNTGDAFDRPAVAVMTLRSLSDDPSDEYLAEGLTDQIVAALSAWRYFPVLSRNTTLNLRGAPDPTEYGMPNARYVLSGSFRRQGSKVKLSLALADTSVSEQIWSHQIIRDRDELLDLEEEIAAQVATIVAPELEGAEARRVLRKPASDLTAWELAMRAAWLIEKGTEADFVQAEQLAAQAIERAPDWSLPYTLIAVAKFQQAMTGFSGADTRAAFSDTMAEAKRALDIDRGSWIAHALTAVGELWTNRNHERALLHVQRAIELNPSASMNYHFGGCITGFSGDPIAARGYQERLLRMDPLYPYTATIESDLGLWHMIAAELPQAQDRLDRAHRWDPRYGRALQRQVVLCGLLDDREGAAAAMRKMSELGLPMDKDTIVASYPFREPEHLELFLDGLRRSGVAR